MKVIDILRSHEQEIKERFAVKRIGLFGSFVRGEETETSDIDILVEFEDPTFRNFMNLAFFLEDLFGRRVDLLTPEGISQRIRPFVEKEVVWADEGRLRLFI
ncbi:MAG: nucleotidyltransferase family protein [Methanotrichaceae archaeon]